MKTHCLVFRRLPLGFPNLGKAVDPFSLPEVIGQKKSNLFVYHQNGLPNKYKVHELRE